MRAFIILAVLPLALADTGSFVRISGHGGSYGYNHGDVHHAKANAYAPAPHPAPAPYKPAPAYHHHAPAYGHHAPAYGGYGYEAPKHNCTVRDVTEVANVCAPTLETVCETVDL